MAEKQSSLNRRKFMGSLAATAAALGIAGAAGAAGVGSRFAAFGAESQAQPKNRPNVLFMVCDDLNDWVGVFGGHPDTKTPNIDRLCKRGVTFQRGYTASPLCNPTRAAIMNGKMASSTGVYDNRQPFRQSEALKDALTLPQYLMKHGYYTAAAGKIYHMHFPDPVSWNDYVAGGNTSESDKSSKSDTSNTSNTSTKSEKKKKQGGDGLDPTDDEKTTVAGITWTKLAGPDSETTDYHIADYVIGQLQKKHDKPFFLGCGFRKPHLSWDAPKKYFDLFPPDKITLPKVKNDDLDDVPPIGKKWAKPEKHEEIVKAGKWNEAVAAYLSVINFVDGQIGRVLDALEASPYKDNTIVVFWGDHGWHLGEKLHWHKSTLWEEADRAPFAIAVPGMTKPGANCMRTVGFISIYPTLVELCGLPPKPDLDGVSLVPLLKNPDMAWDRPAVTDFQYGNRAVRSERWRYIHYADGGEELYDHDKDEYEWTNLAGDPKYADVKKELAKWLPKSYAKDAPHQYFEGDKQKDQKAIDGE